MKGVRNWSVRTRLLLAFLGVLIPYLALAGLGTVGFQVLWQRIRAIQDEVMWSRKDIGDLQLALVQLAMPANGYLVAGDPREREGFEERLAQVHKVLAQVEATHLHKAEEQQLLEEVRSRVSQMEALSREILTLPDPRANRAAPAKMKALDQLSNEAAVTLSWIHAIALQEIEESIARSSGVLWWVMATGLATLILSVVGGVALALLFSAWLSRPIRTIELHGGQIWAHSEGEGMGSTFTMVLSLAGPEQGLKGHNAMPPSSHLHTTTADRPLAEAVDLCLRHESGPLPVL